MEHPQVTLVEVEKQCTEVGGSRHGEQDMGLFVSNQRKKEVKQKSNPRPPG